MTPGTRALAFASRWFAPAIVHRTFEPLIADWQREWHEAEGFDRRIVWVRGAAAFLVSVVAASPNVLCAPWPATLLRRVITRVTMWTSVVTALMLIPFVSDLGLTLDVAASLYLLVVLLPQAVAVAFPFAIITAVDLIRSAPRPNRDERIAAARLGIASVALMLMLCAWVFPAANQQFRVTSFRAARLAANEPARDFQPPRGLRELSMIELFQDGRLRALRHPSGDAIYDSWVASAAGAEPVLREICSRLSLVLLPVVMMWLRWRALRLPRGHWYSPFPLAASAPLLFGSFWAMAANQRALADVFYAPRWSGALLAMAILLAGALAVDHLRRHAAAEKRGPGFF